MSENYRENFITDNDGKVKTTAANNFFWMLKGHPEMRGVLAMKESMVWLVIRPPWAWDDPSEWLPRAMVKNDIMRIRIWMERQGLRPSSREVTMADLLVSDDELLTALGA